MGFLGSLLRYSAKRAAWSAVATAVVVSAENDRQKAMREYDQYSVTMFAGDEVTWIHPQGFPLTVTIMETEPTGEAVCIRVLRNGKPEYRWVPTNQVTVSKAQARAAKRG